MASEATALLVVAIVFSVTGVLFISVRMYVRCVIRKAFGSDDVLILLALACLLLQAGFIIPSIKKGIGKHIIDLTVEQRVDALKFLTLWELTYIWTSTLLKASIGATLLRVTKTKRWIYVLRAALGIVFLSGIVIFFYLLFSCIPVTYHWEVLNPSNWGKGGHCSPGQLVAGKVFLGMTCVLYTLFAILPVFMLWNVKIPLRVKAAVISVLSLGLASAITNLIRIRYLKNQGGDSGWDITYTITGNVFWTVMECGVGIIAACIVTFRPLIQRAKSGKPTLKDIQMWQTGLEEFFEGTVLTTIHAEPMHNASSDDILGNDIVRSVEITTTQECRKGSTYKTFRASEVDLGQQISLKEW